MRSRFGPVHLVLAAVIIGVFLLRSVGHLDLPGWLLFGVSAFVVLGAAVTFIMDYQRADTAAPEAEVTELESPGFVRFLFNDVRSAPVWLVLRLYLGLQWLDAGWGKVTNSAWMDGGTALRGYWERVVQVPEPPAQPPIAYDWYRDFLQFMLDRGWYSWFGPLIAVGEVLVGIALIVGVLVGFAAAAGLMMNAAFMLAGSASTNPVLGAIAILLILAWRVAGYWGVDRYLLPALGAPWSPGWLAQRGQRRQPEPS